MFDEALLDDERALAAADPVLRELAGAGARVRAELQLSDDLLAGLATGEQPRALVLAGPESRFVRAVVGPTCPVPCVAWDGPGLPGWVGAVDTVAVLAHDPADLTAASSVAEADRRGASVLLTCGPRSPLLDTTGGPHVTLLPTSGSDPLASAVLVLVALGRMGLAPRVDGEGVAAALDDVARVSSPFLDLAQNPAKATAIGLADSVPLVWGGSFLAARAARRVAEGLRRATGLPALAADAEALRPVLEHTPPKDLFADPFADPVDSPAAPPPSLLIVDDGSEHPAVRASRGDLTGLAERRGVRVETLATVTGDDVARYATLVASGAYAAAYLAIASTEPTGPADPRS